MGILFCYDDLGGGMGKKVLLIDDDPDLGRLVELILHPIGLVVYQSFSGMDGLRKSYEIHPDLVILDIMMPEMNGFEVCSRLREMMSKPVLILTACTNERDLLHGFEVGADDYIKKPFNKSEFEARVRALIRRSDGNHAERDSFIMSYEDKFLNIDLSTQTVKLCKKVVQLSPREFGLLARLVQEQGRIVSHHELEREGWSDNVTGGVSNPSLYIYYLRKKLQDGKYGHQYINTLWGRGYWFAPLEAE